MDYRELDQLIIKYEEGLTSLEEEKQLRQYLKQPQLPEKYRPLALQFLFFQTAPKESMNANPMARVYQRRQQKHLLWFHRIAIAASLILLLGITPFLKNHQAPKPVHSANNIHILDSEEEALKAYNETQKALALVAEKLNTGTDKLEKLNTFKKAQDLVTTKTKKK